MPNSRLHLTYEEQGRLWRRAGGLQKGCWYPDPSTARRLWLKGWQKEDEETRRFLAEKASELGNSKLTLADDES